MQINLERFRKYLDGFKMYVEMMSETALLDLQANKFFMSQEGYKHSIYNKAQSILDYKNWSTADIGTGSISSKVNLAINASENLVFKQQRIHFKNKINDNPKLAEQVLYNIYCSNKDSESFDEAVSFFGGKYDLIAYLFFIKDDQKYLPISSSNFDKRFALLNIPLKTSRNCSSSNYFAFINCIEQLRKLMEAHYGFNISLLDSHSVIWQLTLADEFVSQMEEKNADALLSNEVNDLIHQKGFQTSGYSGKPKKQATPIHTNGHKVYPRNRFVALNALYIANNTCEIESSHKSFIRKNSDVKYMEPHHLVPMAHSDKFSVSLDVEENIICLCSNCHNEIHYGKNAKELIAQLYEKRKDMLKRVGINISLEELLLMY